MSGFSLAGAMEHPKNCTMAQLPQHLCVSARNLGLSYELVRIIRQQMMPAIIAEPMYEKQTLAIHGAKGKPNLSLIA